MSKVENKKCFAKQEVWIVRVTLRNGKVVLADLDLTEIPGQIVRVFPSRKDAREYASVVRGDFCACGIRSATPMKAVLVDVDEFIALESLARASADNKKDCRYWRSKAYRLTAEVTGD